MTGHPAGVRELLGGIKKPTIHFGTGYFSLAYKGSMRVSLG